MKFANILNNYHDFDRLVTWASSSTKGNFSTIQAYPKQALFRNPAINPDWYTALQNNYRFGKITLPSAQDGTWPLEVTTLVRFLQQHKFVDPDTVIISVACLLYKEGEAPHFHKDPSGYSWIASITLEGEADFIIRRGRTDQAFEMKKGSLLILDTLQDTHVSKHGVQCRGTIPRLNLVIRGVDQDDLKTSLKNLKIIF
jgi:hypothetical protein